ncbi:LLM class oxidoreductase [Pacificoceanicola onchidii]|uniref:LLM class oxidoreductase n=1 Tax=Pacificoceanicola onchidii TaxID=2562685 RepID=UPI0010A68369|nr:LLM class oxidoreductase [Pacificoceanicola onchidii]
MSELFGQGYHRVFREGHLTLGLNFPIEAYPRNPVPQMRDQVALAQKAEAAGYAALWTRDVPLLDPSFGDAGQTYDPWTWLAFVAAQTRHIALATGAIILPLRRPVDLAKAAASIDQLSDGRLILGTASGDRPVEYQVYEVDYQTRGDVFASTFEFVRSATQAPPGWTMQEAGLSGQLQLIPKAKTGRIPMLVTGRSRQTLEWVAEKADGWLMYPQPIPAQTQVLAAWHAALAKTGQPWKPFAQSLYIDLVADPGAPPAPIHLGFRLGRNALLAHLEASRDIGVNHVTLNLRFSTRDVSVVMDELAEYVLPRFPVMQR